MNIDCGHEGSLGTTVFRLSWNGAKVCKTCLDTVMAANRVPSAAVTPGQWIRVSGTARIAKKPSLESYDFAANLLASER